ncbi:FMN-binding protein [Nocardioides KLBMP 9356]|uniref:FMN-binding protein n=1 Tax=Nocardioides potassii TaxID=2911371 RepID=A0ABS9H8D4_9ACTN|nr:FMN-binding protein [Nocardioides potassii]MCF6376709.1 FMN-binding protein [Nocardioides potassii]
MLSTLSTLVVLFGYHTSTSATMATATGSETAITGSVQGSGTGTTTSGSAPPDDGGSTSTGSSGSSSTGSGAGSSSGSSGSGTSVTGAVAQTRYGPVQVQVDLDGSTITDVSVLQYPDSDGRDIQIAQYALPQLIQQTLDSQSGSVSMISGATYTSQGYAQSLQSALDQAGL